MLHIRTPLILHPGLSTPTRRIWLKLENLQPGGSFKIRDIGLLCSRAAQQGKRKVVCPGHGHGRSMPGPQGLHRGAAHHRAKHPGEYQRAARGRVGTHVHWHARQVGLETLSRCH